MSQMPKTFEIDMESSTNDRLYVKIPGAKSSVLINVTHEGIIIDLWADGGQESAATCAATFDEIEETIEEDV
jgi:hypothetical protein